MAQHTDQHTRDRRHLARLHARSFPQWELELRQDLNLCLYGYGSKRHLIHAFAQWLSRRPNAASRIVVVNGYTPRLSIRTVIATIASAVTPETTPRRLVGPPQEMLDTLFVSWSDLAFGERVMVMINSLDGPALRPGPVQAALARLAAHPSISVVASVDTTTATLMWSSTLRTQFNWLFHDATTLAPYEAEVSVVDQVHDLWGRQGRRTGGKEGICHVLRSLPENARRLYRVLLTELLAVVVDGVAEGGHAHGLQPRGSDPGVEYRTLYQKASEEFLCSSEMNFRFLLREFYDHQMITTARDGSGAEMLRVPLSGDDMDAVLEELVMG